MSRCSRNQAREIVVPRQECLGFGGRAPEQWADATGRSHERLQGDADRGGEDGHRHRVEREPAQSMRPRACDAVGWCGGIRRSMLRAYSEFMRNNARGRPDGGRAVGGVERADNCLALGFDRQAISTHGSEMCPVPVNYGVGSSDVHDLCTILEAEHLDRVRCSRAFLRWRHGVGFRMLPPRTGGPGGSDRAYAPSQQG